MTQVTSNKRIAKNTLFLYFRMIVIMVVTLYTSRIVLAELGVDDYGIYMVVGGVVTMFGFLNSCMTTATQRYLNYEMGHGGENSPRLKQIFSTSLTIHLVIAAFIVILAETIGLWFVNEKLVIPEESLFDANVVYQCAILSFVAAIFRVPFNAAIISHEKMQIYAVISMLEALLLLGIAFLLIIVNSQKLAFYGILTLVVHVIIAGGFVVSALHSFKECSLSFSWQKDLFKEMLQFAGWNMFGSVAWIARNQGVGIILNLFFGPALNAAKGVADQVFNAVNSLTSNFQIALNPQITKNYATGNISEMELLAYRGIKFSCILVWMMALPIMINASVILSIWLEDVPPYSSLFVILMLFDCISNCFFGNPLMTSLSATGNIRNYQMAVSCVLLLILPTSYFALKMGCPPQAVFYLNILFNFAGGVTRFAFCKKQIDYSVRFYLRYAFLPIVAVMTLSSVIPLAAKYILFDYTNIDSLLTMIILVFLSLISVVSVSWCVGLNRQERLSLTDFIRSRLKKK
ncbi:MAG: lipopolysaccharide biosynthesis protein [Muribaculaceae bacterium]|nr:lipopolysaccharide biosynthesis protein [Muribaculaceae bacterium]